MPDNFGQIGLSATGISVGLASGELTGSSVSFGNAVKSLVHGRCGCCGFRFRGRQDLEQSLVAEVWRKRKRTLVLHYNFQNVRQVV